MKKNLLVVMAALAIAGCSQNDLVEGIDNGGKIEKTPIQFNSIVKKGSRATVADLDALKTGFYVYAYNTGSGVAGTGVLNKTIMSNEKVSYQTDTWKSTNTFFWPATDYMQFFAYYAKKSTDLTLTSTETDTYPTIADYTIKNAAADQEDLLVAKVTDKTKADATITFAFTHALTKVNFSVKPKDYHDGCKYTVTSMDIEGLNSKGTFNYQNETWTVAEPAVAATYDIFAGSKEISSEEAVVLNAEPFMLLPQTCNATIKVSYTVTDNKGQTLYTATDKTATTTMVWAPNQAILYTIELPDDIAPISFGEPTISNGWDAEDTGTVTQPTA